MNPAKRKRTRAAKRSRLKRVKLLAPKRAGWAPAVAYTQETATAKARELNPYALAKYARDCPASERYQVLVAAESWVDENGNTHHGTAEQPLVFLVASGADWVEALASFHEWQEAQAPQAEVRGPEVLAAEQRAQALAAATLLRQAMTDEEKAAADSLRLKEMQVHGEEAS